MFFGRASFNSFIFWNSQTVTSKFQHMYTFNEMFFMYKQHGGSVFDIAASLQTGPGFKPG